ncbi:MAG: hypothetical protein ACR2IE_11830 [Candidatus Sumerlaeaceae bacterium]
MRILLCLVTACLVGGCTSNENNTNAQADPEEKDKAPRVVARARETRRAPTQITKPVGQPPVSVTEGVTSALAAQVGPSSTPGTPETAPAASPTRPAQTGTPVSTPTLYALTPTPVSSSHGANILAGRRMTPAGGAGPQLGGSEPKELQISEKEPLQLYGYNLRGCTVKAQAADAEPIQLRAEATSNEELTIAPQEWEKLKVGSYTITVTNNRGEAAQLGYTLYVQ